MVWILHPSSLLQWHELEILAHTTEALQIAILGDIPISGLGRLRVTPKVERCEHTHLLPMYHSLDLYHAKHVEQLTQKIAETLYLPTHEVEHTLA